MIFFRQNNTKVDEGAAGNRYLRNVGVSPQDIMEGLF